MPAAPCLWHVYWIWTHVGRRLLEVFWISFMLNYFCDSCLNHDTRCAKPVAGIWIPMFVGMHLWHIFRIAALGASSSSVPWRVASFHFTNLDELIQSCEVGDNRPSLVFKAAGWRMTVPRRLLTLVVLAVTINVAHGLTECIVKSVGKVFTLSSHYNFQFCRVEEVCSA